MHMADALLSPAVGVTFIVASGTALALSARKLRKEADERKVPLMGVLGAFVFAAQMINFSIPGTGSSGHLGGGMLLTILLGPYAAFITIASVLVVQALFFADGGILALGTNIWNMGFCPCFIGWPIYKAITASRTSKSSISIAIVVGTVIALESGSFSVVLETFLSGRSEIPFGKFTALMLGIHFPIALIESVITVAVVNFVYRIRPEIVRGKIGFEEGYAENAISYRPVIIAVALLALFTGGVMAWFASSHPDGLEWSLERAYDRNRPPAPEAGVIPDLAKLQDKTAFFPDYSFKHAGSETSKPGNKSKTGSWPDVSLGTSISGIIGSIIVLAFVTSLSLVMLKLRGKKKEL